VLTIELPTSLLVQAKFGAYQCKTCASKSSWTKVQYDGVTYGRGGPSAAAISMASCLIASWGFDRIAGALDLHVIVRSARHRMNESPGKLFPHCSLRYRILQARDGAEGLKLARQQRPDLIVMNIHLPKISGLEVMKWIKADDDLMAIPIIAVTAFAMKG
jgi:CheY-like chemotaxis protein